MHLHGCRDTRRDAERHLQSAQLPTAGSAGSIRCDWLLRLRVCAVSWRRGSQVTGAGCQMPVAIDVGFAAFAAVADVAVAIVVNA